jgi:hypothetical protein
MASFDESRRSSRLDFQITLILDASSRAIIAIFQILHREKNRISHFTDGSPGNRSDPSQPTPRLIKSKINQTKTTTATVREHQSRKTSKRLQKSYVSQFRSVHIVSTPQFPNLHKNVFQSRHSTFLVEHLARAKSSFAW